MPMGFIIQGVSAPSQREKKTTKKNTDPPPRSASQCVIEPPIALAHPKATGTTPPQGD